MGAEPEKVVPTNFLEKVAEAFDMDMDLEEALRDRLQTAGDVITNLQGQLAAIQQKCARLQKVAEQVPEQSGLVLEAERIVQVAKSLADAGLLSKKAAANAAEDSEVLLGFLEKAADQARREGARMASVDSDAGNPVRSNGKKRESDEHWNSVVASLRTRMG